MTGSDLDPHFAPMWNDPGAVHFVDRKGVPWRVVERSTEGLPGARGPRCLIFLCEAIVRRVWSYAAEWRALSPTELEALSEEAMA